MELRDLVFNLTVKIDKESLDKMIEIKDTAQRLADLIAAFYKECKENVSLKA